jgi:hypothetical protein
MLMELWLSLICCLLHERLGEPVTLVGKRSTMRSWTTSNVSPRLSDLLGCLDGVSERIPNV